jgi:hypothetical protein
VWKHNDFWRDGISIVALAAAIFSSAISGALGGNANLRTWTHGEYSLTIERTLSGQVFDQDLLTIRRDGKLVHAEVGVHIDFLSPTTGPGQLPELMPITSAAGNDIVIESFSGGAHCCFSIEVATLGEKFHISAPLDLRDAGAMPVKLPPTDLYGFRSADQSYAYRWIYFAASPSPEILVRYDPQRQFTLAIDQMRKPKLSRKLLQESAQKLREDTQAWREAGNSPAPDYLRAVLGLIYSGDWEGARMFAFAAWPDWKPGLNAFVQDLFACALPSSPWWASIAELNGVKPYTAGPDCPALGR